MQNSQTELSNWLTAPNYLLAETVMVGTLVFCMLGIALSSILFALSFMMEEERKKTWADWWDSWVSTADDPIFLFICDWLFTLTIFVVVVLPFVVLFCSFVWYHPVIAAVVAITLLLSLAKVSFTAPSDVIVASPNNCFSCDTASGTVVDYGVIEDMFGTAWETVQCPCGEYKSILYEPGRTSISH